MNAFIPVLIAVLLAETGGRGAVFARLPRLTLAATLLGAAVAAAAVAGYAMAPSMSPRARALMIGVALILSGAGQFGKTALVEPPTTLMPTAMLVWRTSVPLLAFAFAIWSGSTLAPVAGAIAGFTASVAMGALIPQSAVTGARRVAGGVLILFGAYSALWALRLIA